MTILIHLACITAAPPPPTGPLVVVQARGAPVSDRLLFALGVLGFVGIVATAILWCL